MAAGPAGVTPVSARAHVFVTDIGRPVLDASDHHHLTRVLRLVAGSEVTAGDGAGGWRPCRLTGGAALAVDGPEVVDARPDPPLTVAFALVKGDRPELVVQKLTELGIDRIVPFVAARSVVRWDASKAARQADRLNEIARQAAMQCRRTWLPDVAPLATFDEVAALDGAALADADGEIATLAHPVVLVGPEGGWTSEERSSQLRIVRLGSHVLRAETAAITAGAVMAALRDGIVSLG
ncbi:MAG: RsmE family RNA methyltransferase [Acidimicrobiales bacterium]